MLATPKNPREVLELLGGIDDRGDLGALFEQVDWSGITRGEFDQIVFGRPPETASVAITPKDWSARRYAIEAVYSAEFQMGIRERILTAFPEKRRLIFIHIPKCAGTDLNIAASGLFPTVYEGFANSELICGIEFFLHLKDVVAKISTNDSIFISGHVPVSWYIEKNLFRSADRMFTVVRNPLDIMLSKVNYVFRCIFDEPDLAANPDVKLWAEFLGLKSLGRNVPTEMLIQSGLRMLRDQRIVPPNYLCSYLGNGTVESALEAAISTNIEITDVTRYGDWLCETWGLQSAYANKSPCILSIAHLAKADVDYLKSVSHDDIVLYDRMLAALERSSANSIHGSDLIARAVGGSCGATCADQERETVLRIAHDQLDEFVAECDRRGSPGSPGTAEYWKDFEYQRKVVVDKDLDPFGVEYLEQQLALYREISGRELNQDEYEHTHFDLDAHIAAPNPYNHPDPTLLAVHLIRLSAALRLAKERRGAKLLDMGCGWGLSSEVAAYLGFEVHAMDINKMFIKLVEARSERFNLGIKTTHSSFDNFKTQDVFDVILFYECLHHAVKPWTLLEKMTNLLRTGGKIILSGEPINEHWWPKWGLRLDPMSVYCIRKHGWFESGWSKAFIIECLDRALLTSKYLTIEDPELGPEIAPIIIASKESLLDANWLFRNSSISGGMPDGQYIVAFADFNMKITTKVDRCDVKVVVHSYRGSSVKTRFWIDDKPATEIDIPPGETKVPAGPLNVGSTIHFRSEAWVPAEEIGNNDRRRLAFQILGLQLG